jgi:hypothetical protein
VLNSGHLICAPLAEGRTLTHRLLGAVLGATAPMSHLGQSRRFDDVRVMSAFPLIATELRTLRDVSNVPQPDSCTAAYSDYFDHFVGADFLEQRFNAHRFMGSDDQV